VLVSFTLYFAISAVNLVSSHAIDKVTDLSWYGAGLVQALKGRHWPVAKGVRAAGTSAYLGLANRERRSMP